MGNIFFSIAGVKYKIFFLPGNVAGIENTTDNKCILIPDIHRVKIRAFIGLIKWYKINAVL